MPLSGCLMKSSGLQVAAGYAMVVQHHLGGACRGGAVEGFGLKAQCE